MKTYLELVNEDSNALYEMANLPHRRTGLPFVVWISPRGNAKHDVRVKVTSSPRAMPADMISVTVRPDVRVVEGAMKPSDLALLRKWVELNRDVLIRFWDGDIVYTEDALAAIRSI